MIRTITLENFRSFGAEQTIPLGKLTVLVGPNNSGKSAFMSIGQLFKDVRDGALAELPFSGDESLIHRPLLAHAKTQIFLRSDEGAYLSSFYARAGGTLVNEADNAWAPDGKIIWKYIAQQTAQQQASYSFDSISQMIGMHPPSGSVAPFAGWELALLMPELTVPWNLIAPLAESRMVRLSLNQLRQDAELVRSAVLTSSGAGLAQVVVRWLTAFRDKSEALDHFLASCVPEIRGVRADEAPLKDPSGQDIPLGTKRLFVEQADGQRFDATQLSDGVLYFIALAMHAIDVPEGSILFVEEPETSIHPSRIHQIIELFRKTVEQRKVQIVIATHSPLVVDEFRDEPENVLVFRRSPTGTQVKRASELPLLEEETEKGEGLGHLLSAGFFDKSFEQLSEKDAGSEKQA